MHFESTESLARRRPSAPVLIVASDPVVGALLALLVEQEGYRPMHVAGSAGDTLVSTQLHPEAVLVALESREEADAAANRARAAGVPVIRCRVARDAGVEGLSAEPELVLPVNGTLMRRALAAARTSVPRAVGASSTEASAFPAYGWEWRIAG